MIYVFEGPRNSGKTYLSKAIERSLLIKRFQFDFGSYFNLLELSSKDNREAHTFSMGKELMIMQMARDLKRSLPNYIHDRGILTVLAWGLSENRITEDDVIKQIEFIKEHDLMSEITIIYINGENPDKSDRNKDQWDYAELDDKERSAFKFVIFKFMELGFQNVKIFENKFDAESIETLKNYIND
jgi:DNA polymerase III delta prime subunit